MRIRVAVLLPKLSMDVKKSANQAGVVIATLWSGGRGKALHHEDHREHEGMGTLEQQIVRCTKPNMTIKKFIRSPGRRAVLTTMPGVERTPGDGYEAFL